MVLSSSGYPAGSGFCPLRVTRQKGNAFEKVRGERVAEGVAARGLRYLRGADGGLHGALEDGRVLAGDGAGRAAPYIYIVPPPATRLGLPPGAAFPSTSPPAGGRGRDPSIS
jgi:hypothetical protein